MRREKDTLGPNDKKGQLMPHPEHSGVAQQEQPDRTGQVMNRRFRLLQPIGSGGTGIVYRALDSTLDREVAVKVLDLRFDPSKDPGHRERFIQEAALTARLSHPNIVTVFDQGETTEGVRYIAMELLHGRTLNDLLQMEGRLPWSRAVEIATQICRALREAHSVGLVHRDLKPANIFLVDHDDIELVKVLDFGLAKPFVASEGVDITQTGVFLGSPTYMAPEQARGQASPQSDIYAFGVIMFRMLTGKVPFAAQNAIDVIVQHLQDPVPTFAAVAPEADVPDDLELLVMRCLEKEARNRFTSMAALLDALKRAGGLPTTTGIYPKLVTNPGFLNALRSGATDEQLAAMIKPSAPQPRASIPPPPPSAQGPKPSEPPVFAATLKAAGVPAASDPSFPIVVTPSGEHLVRASTVRLPWILTAVLSVVLLVGAGLGLRVMHQKNSEAPPAAVVPPLALVPSPSPVKKAPKAPEPVVDLSKPVRFRINTVPAGALLRVNGKKAGRTPQTFEQLPEGDGVASANIVLELEGYHTLSFTAGGYGPEVVLVQRLQAGRGKVTLPSQVERKPAPASNTSAPPAAVAAPTPAPAAAPDVPAAGGTTKPPPAPAAAPDVTAGALPSAPPSEAPAQAVPAANVGPLPLTEKMTRPEIVDMGTPPEFTTEAWQKHIQGTAIAKCVVTVDGVLTRCRMIKSVQGMDAEVLKSLATRRYKPALLDGKPVDVEMAVTVRLMQQH
ncbi:MAG: protein kinase [Myxococcaceae bacterium]